LFAENRREARVTGVDVLPPPPPSLGNTVTMVTIYRASCVTTLGLLVRH